MDTKNSQICAVRCKTSRFHKKKRNTVPLVSESGTIGGSKSPSNVDQKLTEKKEGKEESKTGLWRNVSHLFHKSNDKLDKTTKEGAKKKSKLEKIKSLFKSSKSSNASTKHVSTVGVSPKGYEAVISQNPLSSINKPSYVMAVKLPPGKNKEKVDVLLELEAASNSSYTSKKLTDSTTDICLKCSEETESRTVFVGKAKTGTMNELRNMQIPLVVMDSNEKIVANSNVKVQMFDNKSDAEKLTENSKERNSVDDTDISNIATQLSVSQLSKGTDIQDSLLIPLVRVKQNLNTSDGTTSVAFSDLGHKYGFDDIVQKKTISVNTKTLPSSSLIQSEEEYNLKYPDNSPRQEIPYLCPEINVYNNTVEHAYNTYDDKTFQRSQLQAEDNKGHRKNKQELADMEYDSDSTHYISFAAVPREEIDKTLEFLENARATLRNYLVNKEGYHRQSHDFKFVRNQFCNDVNCSHGHNCGFALYDPLKDYNVFNRDYFNKIKPRVYDTETEKCKFDINISTTNKNENLQIKRTGPFLDKSEDQDTVKLKSDTVLNKPISVEEGMVDTIYDGLVKELQTMDKLCNDLNAIKNIPRKSETLKQTLTHEQNIISYPVETPEKSLSEIKQDTSLTAVKKDIDNLLQDLDKATEERKQSLSEINSEISKTTNSDSRANMTEISNKIEMLLDEGNKLLQGIEAYHNSLHEDKHDSKDSLSDSNSEENNSTLTINDDDDDDELKNVAEKDTSISNDLISPDSECSEDEKIKEQLLQAFNYPWSIMSQEQHCLNVQIPNEQENISTSSAYGFAETNARVNPQDEHNLNTDSNEKSVSDTKDDSQQNIAKPIVEDNAETDKNIVETTETASSLKEFTYSIISEIINQIGEEVSLEEGMVKYVEESSNQNSQKDEKKIEEKLSLEQKDLITDQESYIKTISLEEKNKDVLQMNEHKEIIRESCETYMKVENDIENIIQELLKESKDIKETAVLNGADEEKSPPFTCRLLEETTEVMCQSILMKIVDKVVLLVTQKLENNNETEEDLKQSCYKTTENTDKNPSGDATVDVKVSEIASNTRNPNTKSSIEQNGLYHNKQTVYFCSPVGVNNCSRIPKTSWSFGEHTVEHDSAAYPSVTTKNTSKSTKYFTSTENVEKSSRPYENDSYEPCIHQEADYNNNMKLTKTQDDMIFSNDERGDESEYEENPRKMPLLKRCKKLINLLINHPNLVNANKAHKLPADKLACLSDDVVNLRRLLVTTRNQNAARLSASEDNVQAIPSIHKRLGRQNVDIDIRKIITKDDNVLQEATKNNSEANISFEARKACFENFHLDFSEPQKIQSVRELNTMEEIKEIEKNVEENDRLEKKKCILLNSYYESEQEATFLEGCKEIEEELINFDLTSPTI